MTVVFTLQGEQRAEGIVLAVGWRRVRLTVPGRRPRSPVQSGWKLDYGIRRAPRFRFHHRIRGG
jgi:hypothetical protein